MLRMLAVGPDHDRMWRVARNSVLPSLQDCLVQAWFSLYREGLDPQRMDEDLTPITRHTLRRQLNQRYGDTPVLGMGYGIGWLTHSALVLDQMDNAGRLLVSIARYTYDKKHELRRQHARDRLAKNGCGSSPKGRTSCPTAVGTASATRSNGAIRGRP